MLFEEERFQIGFEGGETWGITQRFGEGISGHRFSILVEFDAWNSHETSVCRMQRVGQLIEDQISKQEQMNLCYDSTGWKSCAQSELGLATNAEI